MTTKPIRYGLVSTLERSFYAATQRQIARRCAVPLRSLDATVRRVRRVGRIDIDVQARTRRNAGRITVAVRRIGLPARGGQLWTSRRLRILPHFGERHSALGGSGRRAGKHASRRRAALIVADEEMNVAQRRCRECRWRSPPRLCSTLERGSRSSTPPRDSRPSPRRRPRHECRRAAREASVLPAPGREK